MNFDPQKFFIGILDFFSILLPGAALAYLLRESKIPLPFVQAWPQPIDPEGWMVFFFVSYLIGHLAFLLGSLLDGLLYDPLRKATDFGQINRLMKGKLLARPLVRRTANWVFGKDADAAVVQAVRIKSRALAPLSAEDAINAFQWSKARLSKDHPEGLAQIQRFEAASKFFRSFAVVPPALLVMYAPKLNWWAVALTFALFGAVIWRYLDQRFKATQQAFWFLITLEGLKEGPPPERAYESGEPTHAGGVVFRKAGNKTEYLIIEARKKRTEWVLPKGHIEIGEHPRATAVREVKEETGHWARVISRIPEDVRFGKDSDSPLTRFYLMELAEEAKEIPMDGRGQCWLPADKAAEKVFEESGVVIEKARALMLAQEASKKTVPKRRG